MSRTKVFLRMDRTVEQSSEIRVDLRRSWLWPCIQGIVRKMTRGLPCRLESCSYVGVCFGEVQTVVEKGVWQLQHLEPTVHRNASLQLNSSIRITPCLNVDTLIFDLTNAFEI